MHKHEKPGTRITVERISVTTIHTRHRSQKVYCDICKQELTPAELISQPLLIEGKTETEELPALNEN